MTDDGWTGWKWVIGDKIDWNGWKWLQKGHWKKWMNMDYCNNMEKLLLPSWWVLKVAELIYRHLHWFDIKVWPHFDQLVQLDSHKKIKEFSRIQTFLLGSTTGWTKIKGEFPIIRFVINYIWMFRERWVVDCRDGGWHVRNADEDHWVLCKRI